MYDTAIIAIIPLLEAMIIVKKTIAKSIIRDCVFLFFR